MAVEFNGGVVMGADSRTTTGSYIANRVSDKITGTPSRPLTSAHAAPAVHDKIWVCRSGSAADTQAVSDYVKFFLSVHAVELGDTPEVKTAANLFRSVSPSLAR